MNKFICNIFSFLFIVYFLSCSSNKSTEVEPDPENNKINFILNGGGYLNSQYELSISNSFINSGAYFHTDSVYTACHIYGYPSSVPHSCELYFSGDSIGLYELQSTFPSHNYIMINLLFNSADRLYPISGQTEVTHYGEIGQRIEGNFAGDFLIRSSFDTLNVVGTFTFVRNEDR